MLSLRDFLEEHRTRKKEKRNFVCLQKSTGLFRQGNFMIPATKQEDLWELWRLAAPEFTEENCPTLVYRPPVCQCQPLQIDIDLRFQQVTEVPVNVHVRFAEKLAKKIVSIVKHSVEFYTITKDTGYYKTIKSLNKRLWANGAHLYFSNIRISKAVARKIKSYAETICLEFYGHLMPVNTPADIIDRAVVERANGLVVIGTFKGYKMGGRYMLRQMGSVERNGELTQHIVERKEMFSQLKMICSYTYEFVWEDPMDEDEPEEEKTEPPSTVPRPPPPQKHVVNEVCAFNLAKFLEITSAHRPSHQEFLQICYFCASVGVPRDQMALLDNRNSSCPYAEFDRRQPGRDAISRGSIVRYLNLYAESFVWDEIFPRKVFFYLSEYDDFLYSTGTTWHRQILENFLTDTISYVMKAKKWVYKDFELKRDSHGNQIKIVTTFIQDRAPFSGSEDVEVRVSYSPKRLLKIIEKRMPKKNSESTEDLQMRLDLSMARKLLNKSPTEKQIRQITEMLFLEPDTVMLSKLLDNKMRKGYIKRYRSLTFEPYLWADPTAPKVYNTFNGFPLLRFKPTMKVNWREHALYQLFVHAYGWNQKEKLEGILNLLAYWIQNPNERDERIFVLLSEAHGIGKSFLAQILAALFSPELVIFFNSYSEFADTFNLCLANRLFWFVDDCSGISQSAAQSLNSKATAHLMKFQEKGERAFWLPVVNSIIITSNDINPLYCPAEDRRQCYWKINPCFKNKRAFFKECSDNLKNYNLMHSFFFELANRDLNGWEPSPSTDLFKETTDQQKEGAMTGSIRFVCEFFATSDWVWKYKQQWNNNWVDGFQITSIVQGFEKGQTRIRILSDQLYDLYKSWNKDKCPGSRNVFEKTFFRQIAKIGITKVPRLRINDNQRTCSDLFPNKIRTFVKEMFPTYDFSVWSCEIPEELLLLKQAITRNEI